MLTVNPSPFPAIYDILKKWWYHGGTMNFSKFNRTKKSVENNFLPLGLSDGAIIQKTIKKDEFIKYNDVAISWNQEVLKARKDQINLLKK